MRSLLTLGIIAAALPTFAAEPPQKPRVLGDRHAGPDKFERRVVIRHGHDEPAERENVAFLGVETARVNAALTAQLGLPRNVGLVVREVVANSPAAATLQRHDLLLKLDDQWLIESRQFSVLIRNHQPGDEVTLTYLRAGKETTAKVKLGQHEVPKLAFEGGLESGGDFFDSFTDAPFPFGGARHVLPLLNHPRPPAHADGLPGPGLHGTAVAADNSNVVFSDERGSVELRITDGHKTLVAKNPQGEQIFSGPVDTDAERAKLPDVVKQQLNEIEMMHGFSFQPGPDFGEDVEFVRPHARKIELRQPRIEAPPARPAF